MRRSQLLSFGVVLVFVAVAAGLWPQSPPPQTYSYTMDPAPSIMGPSVIKAARDGSKEAIDQILPAGPGRGKEYHGHLVYDFQAHKIYTKVVSDPSVPCSVMTYTSPNVPEEFDIFAAANEDSFQQAVAHATLVRKETLNGIPAKVLEADAGGMKVTIWIADPGGYPVKEVMTGQDGKPTTMLEVKQMSMAKPPASALAVPTGCKAVSGEATATGVHAELGSDGSAPKPTVKVTAVTLQSIPNYTGPCPAHIKFTGTITTDGPGKVYYDFGAGEKEPGATIVFAAAGTKTVTHTITFTPTPGFGDQIGVAALLEAGPEDAQGNHDDFSMEGSNNATFMINCTGTADTPPSSAAPNAPRQGAPHAAPNARVTAVNLTVTPSEYNGTCPVTVQLVGTLTADGAGSAYYNFQAAAVGANKSGNVDVIKAGTVTVTNQGVVKRTPQVQSVRFLAGMEPRGHQENAKWSDVQLNIHCINAP